MTKKIILIIISLFLYSCGLNPQRINSSINPADRHIWVPKDSGDLEKRRLVQTNLDGITKEIETLFFNLEMVTPKELNVRESAKGVISKIEAMESDRSNQIINEKNRVDYLNKEITVGIRPDNVLFSSTSKSNYLSGTVFVVEKMFSEQVITITLNGFESFTLKSSYDPSKSSINSDDKVFVSFPENKLFFFDKSTGDLV